MKHRLPLSYVNAGEAEVLGLIAKSYKVSKCYESRANSTKEITITSFPLIKVVEEENDGRFIIFIIPTIKTFQMLFHKIEILTCFIWALLQDGVIEGLLRRGSSIAFSFVALAEKVAWQQKDL